jgi:hypothetical protein
MKRLALTIAMLGCLQQAGALVHGTTDMGRAYVSGGVGAEEMSTLQGERAQYSLSILTASKGSGAYLGDVHIRITDQGSREVFESVMDGPWLLVDLPAGNYRIEAVLGARTQVNAVSIATGGRSQTVFYFDTHDQVEDLAP